MAWHLADAKNRFSELVNRALAGTPQVVLRRRDAVVVLAQDDYEKLTGQAPGIQAISAGEGSKLPGT